MQFYNTNDRPTKSTAHFATARSVWLDYNKPVHKLTAEESEEENDNRRSNHLDDIESDISVAN